MTAHIGGGHRPPLQLVPHHRSGKDQRRGSNLENQPGQSIPTLLAHLCGVPQNRERSDYNTRHDPKPGMPGHFTGWNPRNARQLQAGDHSGLQLAGVSRIPPGEVTGHAGFGIVSSVVITALAILRYSAQVREQRGYRLPWLVLEIGAAALVLATAVMGHKL